MANTYEFNRRTRLTRVSGRGGRSGTAFGLSLGAIVLGAGVSSGAWSAIDPDRIAFCSTQHQEDRQACLDQWGPNGVSPNSDALAQCFDATFYRLLACYDGDPGFDGDRQTIWEDFLRKLRNCYALYENDRQALQACLAEAVDDLRDALCRLESSPPYPDCPPGDDACVTMLSPTRSITVDGAGPVYFQTGLTQAVGVTKDSVLRTTVGEPLPGGGSTIDDACAAFAVQIAVYRDRDGVHARWADDDPTTGDGFELALDLSRFQLGQTDTIGLVELWLAPGGDVVMGKADLLAIESPGGPADWNRDGVLAADDVIGFIDSSALGVPRADLTEDGAHDGADMVEFVDEYTAGGGG